MNFSRVASDKPSILSASLDARSAKLFMCLAWHCSLSQYNDFTSLTSLILVFPPHTGQTSGILTVPLCVIFSAICGIIILALNTLIVSPIPSLRLSIMLILCTLALETLVPSSSTGSNIATGLISPVLEALHSISFNVVSAVSSVHLNAIAFLGNFAVLPSDSP